MCLCHHRYAKHLCVSSESDNRIYTHTAHKIISSISTCFMSYEKYNETADINTPKTTIAV